MSDLEPANPGEGEDRIAGLEVVDGFTFESDGTPIAELAVEAPDSLLDRGETIAEQAIGERSWRFGHVVVDEAQDLTPMQWRMIARRSHGGAITLVGDLAQRSIGEPGEWADHLPGEFAGFTQQELTINYRSPAEINRLATALLGNLAPGLSASDSIRHTGSPPLVAPLGDIGTELGPWLVAHRRANGRGRLAVIGLPATIERARIAYAELDEVSDVTWLDPWQAKGLEFDAVVVVEPAAILEVEHGLSLLYVAVTRTTDRLAFAHERPLPPLLADNLSGR